MICKLSNVPSVEKSPTDNVYAFVAELTDAESAIVRLVEGKNWRTKRTSSGSENGKIYITHEDFDEGAEARCLPADLRLCGTSFRGSRQEGVRQQ